MPLVRSWAAGAAVVLVVFVGVLAFARPAGAVSSNLVVSQVYGGGGNSGATYKNDFIELFNRGTTTVTLTNYTVQYASGNSGTWNIIATLSGTLAPGQYLLIQAGPTGTNGATLSPDVVGATTNLAGTSGKVALVNGT